MPDIRYVILSDLHLGARNSVLTNFVESGSVDPRAPSDVMMSLFECLEALISENDLGRKPTLVLGGDVLELALAQDHEAAMTFECFMGLLCSHSEPLFDETVYFVPGNHDHHLWEGAREKHYADSVSLVPVGQPLPAPWHATGLFETDEDPWTAPLLTALIRRHEFTSDFRVRTFYPNLGLLDDTGTRAVVLHHGHYAESLYRLVSTVTGMMFPDKKKPEEVHEWEAENFAWVDFFWSTLGRSGGAGDDVGIAYDYLQSEVATEYLVHNLLEGVSQGSGHLTRHVTSIVEPVLKHITKHVNDRERRQTESVLRVETEEGLREYIEGPVRSQLAQACNGAVPEHVTFLFGHTHKPFVGQRDYEGYDHAVTVANTGGWVVDTVEPRPLHGAAAILLDENLNGVSVKLYSQHVPGEQYEVSVKPIPSSGGSTDEFFRHVQKIVDDFRLPWDLFSAVAAKAVLARENDLQSVIARTDAVGDTRHRRRRAAPATPPS